MSLSQSKDELKALILSLSYQETDITLASGQKSTYYFDCKQTSLNAKGAYLIGEIFFDKIQKSSQSIQAVGGLTLGADPLATAVSIVSHIKNHPLHSFIVRKEPKKHGTSQWIEGSQNLSQGDNVIVLEDVVSTAGSSLIACQKLEDYGLKVQGVYTIIDRQLGGKEKIQQKGYEFFSIFTTADLIS